MSVRLEDCRVFSEDDEGRPSVRIPTPADVLELARSLPGAEERVRPNGQRILVIELEPAPEPFLPLDLMDSPPKEDE